MHASSASTPSLVIDSNVAVWAVLPVLSQINALERIADWRRGAVRLVAPTLWVAESVSAIRGAVYTRVITADEGRRAVEDLFALEVETVPEDFHLSRSAFDWAGRLQQARAYDGFYLALAERLGVELWTADQRLANASQQAGVTWVRWIGETV